MLVKMLVSPAVWLYIASSVLHVGSAVRERAVEIFYLAAEVEPGREEEDKT